MRTIRTATGKDFDSTWDGVSTIDGALRFDVVNASLDEIHNTFKDPAETETLTRVEDGIESVYTGFTSYRGFHVEDDGAVIVTLQSY